MKASIEIKRGKPASNQPRVSESTQPQMIFGAVAALILDYAVVAAVIGLFLLERWLGIGLGRTLDVLLLVVVVVVVALSVVAWLAGSSLESHLRPRHVISRRS